MALGRGIALNSGQLDQHVLNWTWPRSSPGGQIDPYCEDEESKAISISLDRDVGNPVVEVTDTTESAFWIIRWSAGNLTQVAEIDVQSGTFITVVGQMVSISASYPDLSKIGPATHPQLAIRAVLGFDGGRQSPGITSTARRTILASFGAIAPGGFSPILPVPRFAVAAVMRNDNFLNVGMTFTQFANGAGGQTINSSSIGKLDQDSVPIANGSRFFQLNNLGPAASRVSVVFYLGL